MKISTRAEAAPGSRAAAGWRLRVALGVVLLLGCQGLVPDGAIAALRCASSGTTIVGDHDARVFKAAARTRDGRRRATVFACRYASRRIFRIARAYKPGEVPVGAARYIVDANAVRLVGDFVAYRLAFAPSALTVRHVLVLRNLARSRALLYHGDPSTADTGTEIYHFVLSRTGALAWMQGSWADGQSLRVRDADGQRVLDRSGEHPDVLDPNSLALSNADVIYWTRGGRPYWATVR